MIRKAKALIWGLVIFCATAVAAPSAHAAVSVDTAPRLAVVKAAASASGPLYLCEKYFQGYGWKRIYTRDISTVRYYQSWWGGLYSCYCVAG